MMLICLHFTNISMPRLEIFACPGTPLEFVYTPGVYNNQNRKNVLTERARYEASNYRNDGGQPKTIGIIVSGP